METLKELLDLIKESLKRDEELTELIQTVYPRDIKEIEESEKEAKAKVNENASFEELMDSLKDCMEHSIEAINCALTDENGNIKTMISYNTIQQ
ncbi:hypothetical protein CAEBREN_24530 [Caenorhabditis brenneri]|uniref:Uncharacterized protein n=1 Tax=Caenorhabditis brenneri TaxID=135651 RepID=G0N1U1_CAEBE|nr:hypothetical protein CAEBREN_24530 [Caenorhabditis brenneri]